MFARYRFVNLIMLAVAMLAPSVGCLSLGGKTTYVTEGPETTTRINALESRVSALEQMLGRPSPAPSLSPAPVGGSTSVIPTPPTSSF